MSQPIVADARTRYLEEYVNDGGDTFYISVGMIALGLEIETRARMSERLGDALFESSLQEQIASTLRDLLNSVGIADQVHDEYMRQVNRLNPQPPKTSTSGPGVSQPRSGASSLADAVARTAASSAGAGRPLSPESSHSADGQQEADRTTSPWELDEELELPSEGLIEYADGADRSRVRSSDAQELSYGDEGRMDEE
jgi:hypothetical protein